MFLCRFSVGHSERKRAELKIRKAGWSKTAVMSLSSFLDGHLSLLEEFKKK